MTRTEQYIHGLTDSEARLAEETTTEDFWQRIGGYMLGGEKPEELEGEE
jgi:hypothetical protein